PILMVARQKEQPQSEAPRQADSQFTRNPADESLGNFRHQAGAVTAGAIGINPAAMRQPSQRHQPALYYFMRRLRPRAHNKTRATGIVVGMPSLQKASLEIVRHR